MNSLDHHNPLDGTTVLVIDDEEITAEIIIRAFRQLGAGDVLHATNGVEALGLVEEHACGLGLILCDLNMPEMDGVEFMRHLSDLECSVPVVLTSGSDKELLNTSERLGQAHNLLVLGSISKPVTRAKLLDIIQLLDSHAGRETAAGGPQNTDFSRDDLRHAIDREELIIQYQPKILLAAGAMVSTEALVRWRRSDGSIVPPNLFIPLAEKWGLIGSLTDFVMKRAIRDCGRWRSAGQDWKVAINLSMDCLGQLNLPEQIAAYASEAQVAPSSVCLEVTETRLTENLASTLETLIRLRMRGMTLSIDDFGTGYSSFQQLHGIPFQELKIDRSFVNGASRDEKARAILETSVLLGRKLGMNIVAEGAETAEDLRLIESLGCDLVQGYLFSPPIGFDDLFETARRVSDMFATLESVGEPRAATVMSL